MERIRFVHTADLHLDTPFKGLSNMNPELAEVLKSASYNSFEQIIELCIKEEADFLIVSGDSFDTEYQGLSAQLRFVSGLENLNKQSIPVYLICGNHDPMSSWLETLTLPENVYRFGSSKPERSVFERHGKPLAEITGMSYQDTEENRDLTDEYDASNSKAPFSIAVLHGTAGNPGPHENYAPFKPERILEKGFDYWALGHIHKGGVIREAFPCIVYPGNPQGRDFGEKGAKGCYIVEMDSDKRPELRFAPVNLVRFEEVDVDLTEEEDIARLTDLIEDSVKSIQGFDDETSLILRVTLKGKTPLHNTLKIPGETENLLEYLNPDRISLERRFTWIDSIDVKTIPDMDEQEIKKGGDFASEIIKVFEEYADETEKLNELITRTEDDMGNREVRREIQELTEEEKKDVIENAKWMLLDRLIPEDRQ